MGKKGTTTYPKLVTLGSPFTMKGSPYHQADPSDKGRAMAKADEKMYSGKQQDSIRSRYAKQGKQFDMGSKVTGGEDDMYKNSFLVDKFDKQGSDDSYGISGYVNTRKQYNQAVKEKKSKSPMNQAGSSYKKGDLIDETDHEETTYSSTNEGKVTGKRYNVENVSDIQKDKKGQFMTTLGDNEYYGMKKRPTSSRVTSYDQGRNAVRDTLRPISGKKFKRTY